MRSSYAGFIALFAVAACCAAQQDRNALDVQKARNEHVRARRNLIDYPPSKFDLSALPAYKPEHRVSGTIRMVGSNYIADSHIGEYWVEAFKKFQPDVKFEFQLKTPSAAIPALFLGVSDLGPSRKETFEDLLAYERTMNADPLEIVYATGSYDVPGWSPAFGIFVNKDNPLAHLTMAQLEGVFGAQRTGTWQGTTWQPENGRGRSQNIRTWDQLGLKGKWAGKPIHVYGVSLKYHQSEHFADFVLHGSDKWNPNLLEYANYAGPDGKLKIGAQLMLADLAKDPYGMAYSEVTFKNDGVKTLPIAVREGGPYIPITRDTVHDHSYPLYDQVYMYANKINGKMDPKVQEFLRFVVSREGQEAIARDGKFLPLTPELSREQLDKLK